MVRDRMIPPDTRLAGSVPCLLNRSSPRPIAAQGVARDAARRRMIEWLVGGMALGAVLVGAGFFAGRALGH